MATFMDWVTNPGGSLKDAIRPVAPWLVNPINFGTPTKSTNAWYEKRHQPSPKKPYVAYPGRPWISDALKDNTPYVSHSPTDALYRKSDNLLNTAPGSNEVVKDADYYLQQAANVYKGIDFSGLRDRAQTSVADTDARVKAMYRALRTIQQDEAANREASRSDAGKAITESADKAASDIAQGYENAIQSLSNELSALGIGEAMNQEPAARIAAESGRNQAISRQIGQSAGELNRGLGENESAYNQQIRDITGLEGVDFRSQLQNDLLNRLANLDMAEQQQNQDLAGQRLNYAQGLRNYEQSFNPQGMSVSDQLEAQRIANDASQSLAQRQDAMFQFFMDKKGMDPAAAAQAVNDYFAAANQ